MTPAKFDEILADRIAKTRAVLSSKAREYAPLGDRLYNFKTAAAEFGGTPAQALWGFLVKHLVSVRDLALLGGPPDPARIDEKIGDAINYLILLEAVLLEKLGE